MLKKYYMSKQSLRKQLAVYNRNDSKNNSSLKNLSMTTSMLSNPSISYQTTSNSPITQTNPPTRNPIAHPTPSNPHNSRHT